MFKEQRQFYQSSLWEETRNFIRERDNYTCQFCGKPSNSKNLGIVHHIIEISKENVNDPNITLNPDNLIYLCQTCHNRLHNSKSHYIGGRSVDFKKRDRNVFNFNIKPDN